MGAGSHPEEKIKLSPPTHTQQEQQLSQLYRAFGFAAGKENRESDIDKHLEQS